MKDCVSLEIAKKLKEAGWAQELCAHGTELFYVTTHADKDAIWSREGIERWHGVVKEQTAAPTIGELLEALPLERRNFHNLRAPLTLERELVVGGWFAGYHDDIGISSDTPADALAELWMALKEKGLITP